MARPATLPAASPAPAPPIASRRRPERVSPAAKWPAPWRTTPGTTAAPMARARRGAESVTRDAFDAGAGARVHAWREVAVAVGAAGTRVEVAGAGDPAALAGTDAAVRATTATSAEPETCKSAIFNRERQPATRARVRPSKTWSSRRSKVELCAAGLVSIFDLRLS